MPGIKLKDFCPAHTNEKYALFELKYNLPKVGTTITVKVEGMCEQDEKLIGVNLESYCKYFKALECKMVELIWDKMAGKFSIKK